MLVDTRATNSFMTQNAKKVESYGGGHGLTSECELCPRIVSSGAIYADHTI